MEPQERTRLNIRHTKYGLKQNTPRSRGVLRAAKKRQFREAYQSLKDVLGVSQEEPYLSKIDILYLAMDRIRQLNLCLLLSALNSPLMLEEFGSG